MIEKEIVIVKDSLNKKIIVKVMNYLCRAKTTLIFEPENIYFYRELSPVYNIISSYGKKSSVLYFTFYIINDHKNLGGIDLNESNIRRKPVKYFDTFKKVNFGYEAKDYITKLNEFVEVSEVCSVFSFNINSYLVDKNIELDYDRKKKYKYFSEHFFSYEIVF